jgi:hypothetical protein
MIACIKSPSWGQAAYAAGTESPHCAAQHSNLARTCVSSTISRGPSNSSAPAVPSPASLSASCAVGALPYGGSTSVNCSTAAAERNTRQRDMSLAAVPPVHSSKYQDAVSTWYSSRTQGCQQRLSTWHVAHADEGVLNGGRHYTCRNTSSHARASHRTCQPSSMMSSCGDSPPAAKLPRPSTRPRADTVE